MSSRHLLDPELAEFVETFPQQDYSAGTLAPIRAAVEAAIVAESATSLPDGLIETTQTIERRSDGTVMQMLVVRPKEPAMKVPAILYIHGGGYVSGSPFRSRTTIVELAASTGAVVVAPQYRLAPETRHPGPIDDCHAALEWLHATASDLGVDPAKIAVMGVSAGGGLAASLCLLARDRGELQVVLQVLVSPMLDDRTGVSIDRGPFAGEFAWTAASNSFGWESLLGHPGGARDVSPYASAARAANLEGLPAACILVGSLDLLLEENVEYGLRLARAGVPLELKVYPGAVHAFSRVASAAVTKTYLRDVDQAFATAFAARAQRS